MNAKKWLVVIGSYGFVAALLVVLWFQVFDGRETPPPAVNARAARVADAEFVRLPFLGNRAAYVMLWETERERAWEEDIVYFADILLRNHPLLANQTVRVWDVDTVLSTRLYIPRRNVHDPELRDAFIQAVNELIYELPYLSDIQVNGRIMQIAAMPGDPFTLVGYLDERMLAFHAAPHALERYSDDPFPPMYLHFNQVYNALYPLVNAGLIEINGVCIHEILGILSSTQRGRLSDVFISWSAPRVGVHLAYLGVIEPDAQSVNVTVVDTDGNVINAEMPFLYGHDAREMTWLGTNQVSALYRSRPLENYWFRYSPAESMMYVRLRTNHEMFDLSSTQFWQDVIDGIVGSSGVDTFVLDLRNNWRGELLDGFVDFLRWADVPENRELMGRVYIIVHHLTSMYGTKAAVLLNHVVPDAVVIGQPTYGSTNFFSAPIWRVMPNSGLNFWVNTMVWEMMPNLLTDADAHNVLIPDILIFRTLEDFANSHDPIIEAIRTGIYRTDKNSYGGNDT